MEIKVGFRRRSSGYWWQMTQWKCPSLCFGLRMHFPCWLIYPGFCGCLFRTWDSSFSFTRATGRNTSDVSQLHFCYCSLFLPSLHSACVRVVLNCCSCFNLSGSIWITGALPWSSVFLSQGGFQDRPQEDGWFKESRIWSSITLKLLNSSRHVSF